MTPFSGDLFDGRSSQAHPVSASLDGAQLHITGEGIALDFPLDQIDVAPPVGAVRGVVHLPEGRELHSTHLAALTALSQASASHRPERWARHLESRLGYALMALLVSILVMFCGLRWGVPAVAQLAAHTLPPGLDRKIGEESLTLMDKFSLSPSRLANARQRALPSNWLQSAASRPVLPTSCCSATANCSAPMPWRYPAARLW